MLWGMGKGVLGAMGWAMPGVLGTLPPTFPRHSLLALGGVAGLWPAPALSIVPAKA